MITADVSSLYTSININKMIAVLKMKFMACLNVKRNNFTIMKSIDYILKHMDLFLTVKYTCKN